MSHGPWERTHLHSIPLSHPSNSSPWKGSWLPAMSQWTPVHPSGLLDGHFLSPYRQPRAEVRVSLVPSCMLWACPIVALSTLSNHLLMSS